MLLLSFDFQLPPEAAGLGRVLVSRRMHETIVFSPIVLPVQTVKQSTWSYYWGWTRVTVGLEE